MPPLQVLFSYHSKYTVIEFWIKILFRVLENHQFLCFVLLSNIFQPFAFSDFRQIPKSIL